MADRKSIDRLRVLLLALSAVAFALAIRTYLRTGRTHYETFFGIGACVAIVLLTGRRR